MYTKEDLIRHIKALGVKPDDTILVQCSLKSVGDIVAEGTTSAQVFVEALRECVSDGLLLIPTHTWGTHRTDGQLYDMAESEPCIGVVPKVAAEMAAKAWKTGKRDCVRSSHPTHSLVAMGKDALEYVKYDENASTPVAWEGCFGRLHERKGKTLLVGVNHARHTFLHAVEERLDIPDRLSEDVRTHPVRDYDGNISYQTVNHHSQPISIYFVNYEEALEKTGAVTYGRIGDALVRVCDAVGCNETLDILWKNTEEDLGLAYKKLDISCLDK